MASSENQRVPEYVIYCDESCYDLSARYHFMAIGTLFVPQERKTQLSRQLKYLLKERNLNSEVKWSKVSEKRLDDYREIVNFFFQHSELRFRSIIVDQTKVQLERHGMDKELAFYKFYYEVLEKWLDYGCKYLVLLDYKNNRGSNRYTTLRTYLERHLKGKAWIHDLTIINSKETPLAQLCDVLTGAVAAAYNGPQAGSAKEKLANDIASKCGWSTLNVSTALSENKFNIFRIDLESK